MDSSIRGVTLIELMVVVAIAGTIAITAPPMLSMLERHRADQSIRNLATRLLWARTEAIRQNQRITLCGSSDSHTCNRTWNQHSLIAFIDSNYNFQREDSEPLLLEYPLPHGIYHWHGANRDYMRLRGDGSPIEFGNYIYCPDSKDPIYARQLTVNRAGRLYLSKDKNGDGIHEHNSTGDPLTCL